MKGRFRVDYPWYWTYWFNDDAILRVQIISPAKFFTSMISLAFALVLLILILVTLLAGTTPATLPLVIIPTFAIPLGVPILYYEYARNRLADATQEELGCRKSTLAIPWASIKNARIRNSSLRLRTETKSYKMVIRPQEANDMLVFLLGKLGDRLSVE